MEPGQTEVNAGLEAPVVPTEGDYPGYGGVLSSYGMRRYWTVSAQQALGPVELRVMLGHHLMGRELDLGLGYRLPSTISR